MRTTEDRILNAFMNGLMLGFTIAVVAAFSIGACIASDIPPDPIQLAKIMPKVVSP